MFGRVSTTADFFKSFTFTVCDSVLFSFGLTVIFIGGINKTFYFTEAIRY